jgi:muramoyltetrapeptide carboxypeptidase
VKLGGNVGSKWFQQAGTSEERAFHLMEALRDPQVRAVWCARGGYGTAHLLEWDLSFMRADPKWVIGFSDITVLHNLLHGLGVCSLHAQMPFNIGEKTAASAETLRCALFGEPYSISATFDASIHAAEAARSGALSGILYQAPGECEGVLVGGNLSLLYALRGTPHDLDPTGKILFLEDLDELLYHVDRMTLNLKLAGWFQGLAGLIVGGMSDMRNKDGNDPFGQTAEQIIAGAAMYQNYPKCFQFPAGHIADNRALILGQKAKLSVTDTGATLSFEGTVRPRSA